MQSFDFRSVRSGDALPIRGSGFLFNVPGTLQAVVDQFGISCGQSAVLVLRPEVNGVDLDVFAGADGASITASSVIESVTKQVPITPSDTRFQHISFRFKGIESVVFIAKNGEFRLMASIGGMVGPDDPEDRPGAGA
jgi:hypothetical protein